MNALARNALPSPVPTDTLFAPTALDGTLATIVVGLRTVTSVASTPPNRTFSPLVTKFSPEMTTSLPPGPSPWTASRC